MNEPRLRPDDIAAWNMWVRTALVHAQSGRHQRRVEQARSVVRQVMDSHPKRAVMWSGGKDSTALAHLVSELDPAALLVSEKDDLDYPGEESYIRDLAVRWGATLEVIRPTVSPADWLTAHACQVDLAEDIHSRAAALSRECFYGVVEEANAGMDLVFLGLRKEESRGRMLNRCTRGLVYRKNPTRWNPSGLTVCTPLADWSGIDVYAYLLSRNIEPLPVYRCIGFMHRDEPWRLRKSWWIPGAASRKGGIAWLRRYYPSLFQRLRSWFPQATSYA